MSIGVEAVRETREMPVPEDSPAGERRFQGRRQGLVIAGPAGGLKRYAVFLLSAVLLLGVVTYFDASPSREQYQVLGLGLVVLLSLPLLAWYWSRNWFELDSSELRHFRGGRLRRSFPLTELRGVRRGWAGILLRFARGRVWLNPTWHGALLAAERLERYLDRGSPGQTILFSGGRPRIPLRYLTFPEGCIRCHDWAVTVHRLLAGWKIHVGHAPIDRSIEVEVELCGSCCRRRRTAGRWGWALALSSAVSLLAALAFRLGLSTRDGALVLVAGVVVVGWVLPNWLSNGFRKRLDLRVLGLTGRRYFPGSGEVELEFRDPNLAFEVKWLSDAYREEVLAQPSSYSRSTVPFSSAD